MVREWWLRAPATFNEASIPGRDRNSRYGSAGENEIRGLLKVFGVKLPLRLSRGAFDREVRETIEADPALSHALLPMLQASQVLFDTFLQLDRRVRRAAKDDVVCRRLTPMPD